MISFKIQSTLEIEIESYVRAVISIPSLRGDGPSLKPKDLIAAGPVSDAGKFTTQEHLEDLLAHGELRPDAPLLVFGLRNTLVNHRCIAELHGSSHSLEPEVPQQSERPYYGLFIDAAHRIGFGRRSPKDECPLPSNAVFISGVPAGWEGSDDKTLADTILIEASDHSHVFELERGGHPNATDATRARWQDLHEAFLKVLHARTEAAVEHMRSAVAKGTALHPQRGYLHQVIGCNAHGQLRVMIAHDSIQNIGAEMARRGFHRSVCVENSGSVQPSYFPRGACHPEVPLLRAPNFRPRGRALLVLELGSPLFGLLSGTD